jgi:hypothetical protein
MREKKESNVTNKYLIAVFFCHYQLQDTTNLGENALHMSWQDGGKGSSSGHAVEPYPELLPQPEQDSSMQIGYVFLHANQGKPDGFLLGINVLFSAV